MSELPDTPQQSISMPAAPIEAADPPPARQGLFLPLLASLALSLCLTAAALYVYDTRIAQKLVVLDMNAFLNEQRELLLAGKNAESDRRFDELEARLNLLPDNNVVLLKSVAVRNATEIKP